MLALVVSEIGGKVAIHQRSEPQRSKGDSLIRVKAAVVGHLDSTISTGSLGVHPELPYIPGVEAAGVVVESDSLAPGTGVVIRGAGVGVFSNGTWAEYVCVSDQALMPIPQGLDFQLAAGFFVPTTTAFIAVHDIGKISSDSTVLVTGVRGAVGSLTAEMCINAGARVVGMSRDTQSPLPPHLNSVEISDYCAAVDGEVLSQFDLVVDTVAGNGFSERLSRVKQGGIVALVGYAAGSAVDIGVPGWILSDTTVVPVNMLNREVRAREVSQLLAQELLAGRLHLHMVGYSPTNIHAAQADVQSGKIRGRAFISFDD
jgi:NADPH:quinone reductase-like Zn-dependent oxidoreductase